MQKEDQAYFRAHSLLDALASSLRSFSLDLVKLVLGYVVYGTPTAGSKPKLLAVSHSFAKCLSSGGACVGVGCSLNENNVWLLTPRKVDVCSADGHLFYQAFFPAGIGQWHLPNGIAVAANGEAFITDNAAHCVVFCRANGEVVRRIGSEGRGHGQFTSPHGIAVDSKQGLMFVGDSLNRVQVLELNGSFVWSWPLAVDGKFHHTTGIALSSAGKGEVAVSDYNSHCVRVFDYNGRALRLFGSGQLKHPCGLAIDSAGNWLCCDFDNRRVCVFRADGSFLCEFDDGTVEKHIFQPYGVCVDRDGRILVAANSPRLFVFAFCDRDSSLEQALARQIAIDSADG